jgi:hypothetical protein
MYSPVEASIPAVYAAAQPPFWSFTIGWSMTSSYSSRTGRAWPSPESSTTMSSTGSYSWAATLSIASARRSLR